MPTVATVFNNQGYHTAYFGKWHLDGFKEAKGRAAKHIVSPERRGDFQDWIGYENNNSQWDCWVHGQKDGQEIDPYRLPGYETDETTNLLLDYLKERGDSDSDQPFFAVMSVQPPHNPYVAPEEYMDLHNMSEIELRENVAPVDRIQETARRELAGYYAQIENLDWNIGRIRKALQETDLAENTHIIFFSDHGDMHGSHGQFRKTTAYQESINIPFIISGAQPRYDGWKTGRIDVPLNHVDIAPTTLGLCGIDKPDWMMGTDYSHYRIAKENPDSEPDSAFLQSVIPTGHGNSVNRSWRGIITREGWKYVTFEQTPWMMFNLNEDPYEQANLVHNNVFSGKRKELKKRLKKWITETEDDFPVH
ncbi:MAG: sulfatase-like hydrolase/transferase [Halanaerobiales bacterium]